MEKVKIEIKSFILNIMTCGNIGNIWWNYKLDKKQQTINKPFFRFR